MIDMHSFYLPENKNGCTNLYSHQQGMGDPTDNIWHFFLVLTFLYSEYFSILLKSFFFFFSPVTCFWKYWSDSRSLEFQIDCW